MAQRLAGNAAPLPVAFCGAFVGVCAMTETIEPISPIPTRIFHRSIAPPCFLIQPFVDFNSSPRFSYNFTIASVSRRARAAGVP